ncbi:hypothetical protein GCM10028820_21950 [Tessaracoccus terricola]
MLRRMLAGLLVAVAAVLAPVAVAAVWTKQTVTDQERYLDVVSEVSAVPSVQQEVRGRVVEAIVHRIDPGALTAALVDRAVTRAVESVFSHERFGELWLGLNRVVHAQVTGVLAGESAEFELSDDGTLAMRIGPVVEALAAQLEEFGVEVPPGLATDETVVLVQSRDLVLAQSAHDLLVLAAAWLPLVCVVGLCLGLLLVERRAQALFVAGLVTAGVAVALVLALQKLLATLDDVVAREAASTLLASLSPWMWATAVVGGIVAVVAGVVGVVIRQARSA